MKKIQSLVCTFMPPSCHIIKMIVRDERWDLISESSPVKIGELITYTLSDEYIYTHPKLRKAIQADRKGYVDMGRLCQEQPLADYFLVNNVASSQQKAILSHVIPLFCLQLKMMGNRVRRIRPFNTTVFKSIKPLCIERLQENLTISDIRHHLGETAFSQIEQFKTSVQSQFLYVYAPDYRQKMQGVMPFRVGEYHKVCADRDRESRYWQQQQRRFYSSVSLEIHMRRELYNRNFLNADNGRIDAKYFDNEEMMDNQQIMPMESIAAVIQIPNSSLNQLLVNYIGRMKDRLDQQ